MTREQYDKERQKIWDEFFPKALILSQQPDTPERTAQMDNLCTKYYDAIVKIPLPEITRRTDE